MGAQMLLPYLRGIHGVLTFSLDTVSKGELSKESPSDSSGITPFLDLFSWSSTSVSDEELLQQKLQQRLPAVAAAVHMIVSACVAAATLVLPPSTQQQREGEEDDAAAAQAFSSWKEKGFHDAEDLLSARMLVPADGGVYTDCGSEGQTLPNCQDTHLTHADEAALLLIRQILDRLFISFPRRFATSCVAISSGSLSSDVANLRSLLFLLRLMRRAKLKYLLVPLLGLLQDAAKGVISIPASPCIYTSGSLLHLSPFAVAGAAAASNTRENSLPAVGGDTAEGSATTPAKESFLASKRVRRDMQELFRLCCLIGCRCFTQRVTTAANPNAFDVIPPLPPPVDILNQALGIALKQLNRRSPLSLLFLQTLTDELPSAITQSLHSSSPQAFLSRYLLMCLLRDMPLRLFPSAASPVRRLLVEELQGLHLLTTDRRTLRAFAAALRGSLGTETAKLDALVPPPNPGTIAFFRAVYTPTALLEEEGASPWSDFFFPGMWSMATTPKSDCLMLQVFASREREGSSRIAYLRRIGFLLLAAPDGAFSAHVASLLEKLTETLKPAYPPDIAVEITKHVSRQLSAPIHVHRLSAFAAPPAAPVGKPL
ncbi:N-terminal domain-containing protein [Cyclospora cayetanensis]|uniref:N-terminal domain-containing protein n=1 Tax=Cyclospora cayetanensis TaxID=88456 RepID=A0A1D3D4W8_9EIME|nr:N-terminal domain-containing protein [Cyclospora cayetanensis]